MAEEIDDNRFKTEVMHLLGNLINKANETTSDLSVVHSKLESLDAKVDTISKQFNDVGVMAIKDNGRITQLESVSMIWRLEFTNI